MRFLFVIILFIKDVYFTSPDFNEYLNSLKLKLELLSLGRKSLQNFEKDLKSDLQFMASKPYWQQFNPGIDSKHFVTWLEEKASFRPVWKSVSRYARPDSQETFDKGNKKNSSNLESHKNQTRIKQAYKEHLESLQNIESKYYINAEVLVALAAMESRLGKFRLKYKAHEVFLTQLLLLNKFSHTIDKQRLSRLLRSARRNLACLYLWATATGQQEVESNWAGACGVVQFLPYNFWMLKDGNGDNEIQLNNLADGFASSAFFLNQKGWGKEQSSNFKSGKFDNIQLRALLSYNRNEFYAKGLWNLAQWLKNNNLQK
ncbi:MAG: lytic murein transglycosylase [bacterium]|nr:lytic murein transglycosylase [bacterium]